MSAYRVGWLIVVVALALVGILAAAVLSLSNLLVLALPLVRGLTDPALSGIKTRRDAFR
jgi:hypothetical protein